MPSSGERASMPLGDFSVSPYLYLPCLISPFSVTYGALTRRSGARTGENRVIRRARRRALLKCRNHICRTVLNCSSEADLYYSKFGDPEHDEAGSATVMVGVVSRNRRCRARGGAFLDQQRNRPPIELLHGSRTRKFAGKRIGVGGARFRFGRILAFRHAG
jgi:hypothetical protein